MPILHSTHIVVDRGGKNRFAYPDFSLNEGDTVLLTGPSGCGKTTFLSVLAGLLPPTSGTVRFEGQDFYAMPARARDKIRGQKMGFVFQTLHLLPSLTLRQNIALAAPMAGCVTDPSRVDDLITQFGLSHRAAAKPDSLSQGEQQRAAIARAVLNKPSIIFADEPTSALDHDNALNVVMLLQEQALQTKAALVVASHDERIMKSFNTVVAMDSAGKAQAV